MARAKRWLVALASCLPLSTLVPAFAAEACDLSVFPAQVEQDLGGRSFKGSIVYENSGTKPCVVELSLQRMVHDLDGNPVYRDDAATRGAFRLTASSFSLAPDAKREVEVSGSIPRSARSAYFAVLTSYATSGATPDTVQVRTRIASQFLLRAPAPWHQKADVIEVGVLDRSDERRIYAIVRNTGDVHVRPSGTVIVRQGSRTLGRVRLEPDHPGGPPRIFPGLARRLIGVWTGAALPDGVLRLDAVMKNPGARGSATVEIKDEAVLAPGASLDVETDLKGGVAVHARLENSGTLVLDDTRLVFIATDNDGIERGRQVFPQEALQPGQVGDTTWRPVLADGLYTITVRAERGGDLLDQKVVSIRVGEGSADADRWSRTTLLLFAAFLLAAVGIVVGLAMRRQALW